MFINFALKCFRTVLTAFSEGDEIYHKYAKFKGMQGPINCLSFSHSGELLASGGDDETVRIWDVSTRECIQNLEDPGKRWGQITCVTWLGSIGNDELKPIAFGTGRGLVVIYRRSGVDTSMVELASTRAFEASDPVESIDYDSNKSYLATTSHHGQISLYDIGRNGTLMRLWTESVNPDKGVCIPRSIRFYSEGKKLLIFVLETGEMICRDVETSREDWRKLLKSGIGNATIGSDKLLLIDNLSRGFDLYNLPRSSPSYTFSIATKKRCVKDGVFAEQASTVVCGSDHGWVYVFSTAWPTPIQVLKQARKTVEIQAIDATSTTEAHFIASGTTNASSEIVIWQKLTKKTRSSASKDANGQGVITLLNCLIVLFMVHWTSAFWMPIASQTAKETLTILNNMSGQTTTFKVQPEKRDFTEWDVKLPTPPASDNDDDDDDESMTDWEAIQKERLSKWDEL